MRKLIAALCLAMLCAPVAVLADQSSAHFRVINSTINFGGSGSSASYKLSGTMGEVAHGSSTSATKHLQLGFFSFPAVSAPVLNAQVGNVSQAVNLSWSASIGSLGLSVSGYKVGRATSSGGPYTYTSVGNVLLYDATGLTNGVPYYFVAVALDQSSIQVATSSEVVATPVSPTLTFIVDSGTQALPALTPGSLSATSSILTATTNNASGFSVTLARANTASTTLLLSTDASVQLPDKTDWLAPGATTSSGGATASTTQPNTLQFRLWKAQTDIPNYSTSWWGSDDTQSNALFAGIPSTTQPIANRSVSALSTTTMRVLYNIAVPSTQKTGTYQGSVVYSVVANP
jgi:hypothetical protein